MAVQIYQTKTDTKSPPQRIERKFYLLPQRIGLAYGLLQHVCHFDTEFPSEQINSLYFDTTDLDQHERSSSGELQKDKVRIRWYGKDENVSGTQTIFIELKSRRGFVSTKLRHKLSVPAENLSLNNLKKGIIPKTQLIDTLTDFGYFPAEPLLPIVKISYWRYRFTETLIGQRVSLDYHIRSTMIVTGIGDGERNLELPGAVIEIKGTTMEIPIALKSMKILDLDWSRFSKYSSCIDSHSDEPCTVGRLSPSGKVIWQ